MRLSYFGFSLAEGSLHVGEFVAANLEGVCILLHPERAPAIVMTEAPISSGAAGLRIPILYSPGTIILADGSGKRYSKENAFIVNEEQVFLSLQADPQVMSDTFSTMLALWQMVLHEARHFVQFQILGGRGERLPDFDTLTDRLKNRPDLLDLVHGHLQSYGHLQEEDREKEADAVMMSLLAALAIIASFDGESECFDFGRVRTILLGTRGEEEAIKAAAGL